MLSQPIRFTQEFFYSHPRDSGIRSFPAELVRPGPNGTDNLLAPRRPTAFRAGLAPYAIETPAAAYAIARAAFGADAGAVVEQVVAAAPAVPRAAMLTPDANASLEVAAFSAGLKIPWIGGQHHAPSGQIEKNTEGETNRDHKGSDRDTARGAKPPESERLGDQPRPSNQDELSDELCSATPILVATDTLEVLRHDESLEVGAARSA